MYAGRVACCLLVNHDVYAPYAVLRLEKRQDIETDGRTDGRTPDCCMAAPGLELCPTA